jgi:hypothetical protein
VGPWASEGLMTNNLDTFLLPFTEYLDILSFIRAEIEGLPKKSH